MAEYPLWAKEYERCIRCGTIEIPHFGKGYCRKCYFKVKDEAKISRMEVKERIRIGMKKKWASRNSVTELLTPETLKELYLVKKMSLGDIAKQYNCSRTYIFKLCRAYGIPVRNKSKARNLALKGNKLDLSYCTVNEDFFGSWSNEMAYVLGLFFADGFMNKHMFCFSRSLKEKDFLEQIRDILGSTHPIKKSSRNLPFNYRKY